MSKRRRNKRAGSTEEGRVRGKSTGGREDRIIRRENTGRTGIRTGL